MTVRNPTTKARRKIGGRWYKPVASCGTYKEAQAEARKVERRALIPTETKVLPVLEHGKTTRWWVFARWKGTRR